MKVTIKELIIESDNDFKSIKIEIENGQVKSTKLDNIKSEVLIPNVPSESIVPLTNISENVPIIPDITNRTIIDPAIMDDEF